MSEWSDSAKAALADAARSKTVGGIPVGTMLTLLGLIASLAVATVSWGSSVGNDVAALKEGKATAERQMLQMASDVALLRSQQSEMSGQVVAMRVLLDERLPRKER